LCAPYRGKKTLQMNETGVVWIEAAHTQSARQVCFHLKDVQVLFSETLQQIADSLDRIADGAVFLKLPLPGVIPSDVLALVRDRRPGIPLVVQDLRTDQKGLPGVADGNPVTYISGDVPLEQTIAILRAVLRTGFTAQLQSMEENINRASASEKWRDILIGESPAMQAVIRQIRLLAPRNSTVLITGETGTGKEVVARAIHMASDRSHRQMVAFNCGALPEALLEAELFGHAKGAFTGAINQRIGRFEQAHQSSIFLDEIGDMEIDLQTKLLRVLQEREFHRLGSPETVKVNVRVIAATNIDLLEAVEKKCFREDLYYRLNVISIRLPPLRERTGDISLLLHHFIDKVCRKERLPLKTASPSAIRFLSEYSWPGNVRQLEHAAETAIVLSGDRQVLEPSDFPVQEPHEARNLRAQQTYPPLPTDGLNYEEMLTRVERYVLSQAIEQAGGNKSRAADLLQMKRSTLVSRIKALACKTS
jgi:DNA-binding NtrC family response regulator